MRSAVGIPRLQAREDVNDGVTCSQALRQIEEFMSTDWGTLIGLPTKANEKPLPWACAT
jgi:hypothetical protein